MTQRKYTFCIIGAKILLSIEFVYKELCDDDAGYHSLLLRAKCHNELNEVESNFVHCPS